MAEENEFEGPEGSAVRMAQDIRKGALTSFEVVETCLNHIQQNEDRIGAFAFLDRDLAFEQARLADEFRSRGQPTGPLHGVPVAIKDIVDTFDMPTCYGTKLHAGRQPAEDASLVVALREAGAIIIGKTVTTELAYFSPGKTRNPHNVEHSPGGSSSGSAAAVAAGMVPVAIGSQTNGSMIRPAAYCGVFGLKPTFGSISRHRVLKLSSALDTMGIFARSLEDIALVGETLMRFDRKDPAMMLKAPPKLIEILRAEPPVDTHIAFVRSPVWDEAEAYMKDACRELLDHMGETVEILDLPASFDDAHRCHSIIMDVDMARSFAKEYRDGRDQLSDVLVALIERGQKTLATDYQDALELMTALNEHLDMIFEQYDAILTPSASGEAPASLENTGSPAFCTIWTFCGAPSLNLPIMEGPSGLPLGVQLVTGRGDDARLLRTARWLMTEVGS